MIWPLRAFRRKRNSPALSAYSSNLGLVCDCGDGSVLTDTFDAVFAGGLALVDLGGGDDLAVGSLQIELDAGCDVADDKFTHSDDPFFLVMTFILQR